MHFETSKTCSYQQTKYVTSCHEGPNGLEMKDQMDQMKSKIVKCPCNLHCPTGTCSHYSVFNGQNNFDTFNLGSQSARHR